ncbi:albino3-like protein 1, chloroplastic [Tanacetum coccineum]|uniref:Albino3-like protein 1, chloroplastic n=1 Tax=Tanacetum coccineum TaxID=301880 RepID=A0ABQ5ECE2_9ASTR
MLNYQQVRERALQQFKHDMTPILVATDVASKGLDIPRVAHVINFDLSRDIDSHVYIFCVIHGIPNLGIRRKLSSWFTCNIYLYIFISVFEGWTLYLHVPYSYGFAILLLTVLVKAATFPLSKKQVESAMAMRSLQPQIKAIQERYAGDQERLRLETARLYKLAGINPLADCDYWMLFTRCLPTLATIPVWIGLYRALSNVVDEGLLAEGFFWILSLAGPITVVARQSGSGIS